MIQRRIMDAISLIALLSSTETLAGRLAQLEVATQGAAFHVLVDEDEKPGRNIFLTVDCIERCNQFSRFRERVDAKPLGLFRLTDAYPLIMTTWSEGTSTKIRIYRISSKNVQLVFNEYTLGTPTITPDGGVLSLTLPQYFGSSAGSRRKIVSRTWTWKTERFLLTRR